MLVGRDDDLARFDALLAGLRDGLGFALAVRGPAGVGKSALLDAVSDRADGLRRLRACGVQTESELEFSGLHELVEPVLGLLERLPAHQQRALRASLALADDQGGAQLTLFAAATGLLTVAAREQPLLCLIDDAQWLDAASRDVLLFAARRLLGSPVGFVFGVRDEPVAGLDGSWLPTLTLDPLGAAAAHTVVTSAAPGLPPDAVAQVVSAAAGNPLALLEFARTAGPAAGSDSARGPAPLPVSEQLERMYGAEAQELPAETRTALVVLAAAGAARGRPVLRAVESLVGPGSPLDAALDAGLLATDGAAVRFRHPLVHSAVYQRAPASQRRAAHAALAEAFDGVDPEASAWHRALAATGPDERVATALQETATLARRRGGRLAEARALELAAQLSEDAGQALARLLAAGTAAMLAGQQALARRLLDEVSSRATDPRVLADAEHERAQLLFWQEGRRSAGLLGAAERVQPVDRERAARLFSYELVGLISDCQVAAALPAAERAWALIDRGAEPLPVAFRVAHVLVMAGRTGEGADLTARVAGAAAAAGNLTAMIMVSQPLWWLERYDEARTLVEQAVAELRATDGLWLLGHGLINQAELERRTGRLHVAHSAAAEAVTLAEQLAESLVHAEALVQLAAVEALLGHDLESRAHAEQALRIVGGRPAGTTELQLLAAAAVGGAALANGRPGEAADRLAPVVGRVLEAGVADPAVVPCLPDLIEAYIATGRGAEAAALLAWLSTQADRCDRRWARLAAARCQASLDASPAALADLEALLAVDDRAAPLESARAWLTLGAALRRRGQRRAGRSALREAHQLFASADAAVWAARAGAELRACGEQVTAGPSSRPVQLTPQESRVAQLAAHGARNREISHALHITEKTVETHLASAFRKLGVRSRTELAGRLSG